MPWRFFTILIVFNAILLLVSCRPTRHIQAGEYLVTKSVVHLNENNKHETEVSSSDLESILRQKPNRKVFGLINFHLGVWNFAHGRNQSKNWVQFLKTDVGEAPVLFEPVIFQKNIDQLKRYLSNNGHFDAQVSAQSWLDTNTAELHYYINSGPAYTLRRLGYSFEDDSLRAEFSDKENKELNRLKLTRGSTYSTDLLTKERERFTRALKDLGYYTFDKIHVIFDIDTNLPGNRFDVMIRFRDQRVNSRIGDKDSVQKIPHLKHRINSVTVNENYNANTISNLDSIQFREYTFLYLDRPYVRPARISRNIFLNRGELYSLSKMQYTYERINSLGTFRFIDIEFEDAGMDEKTPLLDMRVNLNKAPKQAMTFETLGTNRSGNLGISSSINYRNKNFFRGAERFEWKVYGGLEWQNTNTNLDNENSTVLGNTPINTYEFGTQLTLTIPDFLLRNPNKDLPRIKEPKTSIILALDRQGRPQFDRDLINTGIQWSMRLRKQDQLVVAPIDLSVINLRKTDAFTAQLQQTRNPLLISSYSDHIIPAGRASYSYSTQNLSNPLLNFYYYKLNVETAGNLLRLSSPLLGLQQSDNSYLIDTIAYAQYIKSDFEYKKYFVVNKSSSYIYRVFIGAGLPLANREALPFDRSFFAGGSNSIRAWRARALGPGNVADTTTFGIDQVGELQLEMNLEYRFDLIKQLEGALFVDMGNIWFWNDESQPKANFNIATFYKAIAIAPGAGVRLNLNFFVIRLDAGFQLKDPNLPEGERWAFFQPKTITNSYRQEWRINNSNPNLPNWRPETTLNLAIDYPF